MSLFDNFKASLNGSTSPEVSDLLSQYESAADEADRLLQEKQAREWAQRLQKRGNDQSIDSTIDYLLED